MFVSFIAGLTKEPLTNQTADGKNYYLLRLAHNVFKRDEKGDYIKDEKDYKVVAQTNYISVFAHSGCDGVLDLSGLKPGDLVRISGQAKFKTQLDENNYEQSVLTSVTASKINTNPFDKQEKMITPNTSVTEVENIPL